MPTLKINKCLHLTIKRNQPYQKKKEKKRKEKSIKNKHYKFRSY